MVFSLEVNPNGDNLIIKNNGAVCLLIEEYEGKIMLKNSENTEMLSFDYDGNVDVNMSEEFKNNLIDKYTETEIADLTKIIGRVVYNTTDKKMQGCVKKQSGELEWKILGAKKIEVNV